MTAGRGLPIAVIRPNVPGIGATVNVEVTVAHARHVICAKAADATCNVTSTKAADMGFAEATAATTVFATTMTTSLCAGGSQTAGKQSARQNHHYSSFHDILHSVGRNVRRRARR